MRLADINTTTVLRTKVDDYLATTTIYTQGQRPTSGLPDSFVEISENGSVRTASSRFGLAEQDLLLAVYVKLLPTDTINTVKERLIMDAFAEMFKVAVVEGAYSFSLAKENMFSSGKNIITGYSTKFLNIKSTIKI